MTEILFNSKIKNYTLKKEIDGIKSVKKVPLKFKPKDTTAKYREDILKSKLENKRVEHSN